ncbi:MAG TPA: hypothetical protein VIE36_15620 [Methylomirabilota bacterium]
MVRLTTIVAVLAVAGSMAAADPGRAQRPRVTVDVPPSGVGGRLVTVPAGGNLQAVLDDARRGDVIVLRAGATFMGPLRLPRVPGDGWIEIRSSEADDLPPGRRIGPDDASKMARIVGGDGSVAAVRAEAGVHHVRFVGIEFTVTPGVYNTGLVRFGTGQETSEAELPHHLVIDRCWIHGDPATGGKRGLSLNARHVAVVDSYFSDWKRAGQDTTAISGWNGPGPFKIANNYLEAAGINVLFGGGDAIIRDLVPSDIEITRNYFSKPLSWRKERWTVKNLFELKNARRVLVSNNIFEHTWGQAQAGTAILLSPRNQDGGAPWSRVEDVTFIDNVVRGAASGIKISGSDDTHPSGQTRRILIGNNLFEDIDGRAWGGNGRLFTLLRRTDGVVIEHNTAFPTGTFVSVDGPPHTGFILRNNIARLGEYGIKGTGLRIGMPTLRGMFPDARVEGNVFIGRADGIYPPGNIVVGSLKDVGFVDADRHDWRLHPGSRFKSKANGRDPGIDAERIESLRLPARRR